MNRDGLARRALVAGLLALTLLAACASPSGPVAIPSEDLPFELRRRVEASEPSGPERRLTVHFVRRGRLVAVRRDVPTALPLAEAAMRALLEGPTEREQDRAIASEIPSETRLIRVVVVQRVAQVDLSGEFQGPATSESILFRVAQVVWTLTRLPGIETVRFTIGGAPVSAVTDRGAAVDRPVGAADYGSVGPRR